MVLLDAAFIPTLVEKGMHHPDRYHPNLDSDDQDEGGSIDSSEIDEDEGEGEGDEDEEESEGDNDNVRNRY